LWYDVETPVPEKNEMTNIEVLPDWQGKGIGTTVIQRMIEGAQKAEKPFRLQVFKVNPARKLYERLGFIKTGETETHIQMEFIEQGAVKVNRRT
jgi:ribosomal protein S18 acetylase RimI-like enzyme